MFRIFNKSSSPAVYINDIHSHLIPGIDDGVKSFDEALRLLKAFEELETKKVITTPHIMSDLYPNQESEILKIWITLKEKVKQQKINIEVSAAAEYFLDEALMEKMTKSPEVILTFSKKYLLFETPFYNRPLYLNEFIFKAQSAGFKPVLAHPERYNYLHGDIKAVEELIERGVLLQLNIISLSGFYSKQTKKFAEQLIEKKLIHFVGSDCHNAIQHNAIIDASKSKFYNKALELPLKNYDL